MPETVKLVLLFTVGFISGIINVNAGGGSSITLPVLIFLGLEGALANGTNRIGILLQNLFAISSFKRQNVHHFRESLLMALFTLPGAVAGALLSVRISHELFQRILAIVMIGIVFSIVFSHRKIKKEAILKTKNRKWIIFPVMLGIGFYGGFLQIGVGFLLMASLYHLLEVGLVHVNMHKVFIVFLYTIPALCIFIWSGNINWGYGIILAGGTSLGAWWGARIAVKGGEKVIRDILAVAILLMSLKLFGVY